MSISKPIFEKSEIFDKKDEISLIYRYFRTFQLNYLENSGKTGIFNVFNEDWLELA
jgi:hypothetical protein